MRDNIILKCTECGEENYINTKNKRNHPDRMEANHIDLIAPKKKYTLIFHLGAGDYEFK